MNKNNMSMPRFRGITFEVDGGWSWEIRVDFLGDNDNGLGYSATEIYPTREDAIVALKIAVKEGCDAVQEELMGEATGEYIDMKTNETMKWDKNKHN